jgi:KaiC/GvpD/RAD55 family RecA-like ATPase/CheY-like chemotaxis protein
MLLSGIAPFDERTHGLETGGTYLLVGTPGPAKMVATLHFIHAGAAAGEQVALVTNSDPAGVLEVARAWGLPLDDAWRNGRLQIVGFRDDFELRAMRTIAPEEVFDELASLIRTNTQRIAIDPGSMFLTGGAKTVIGAAFMAWARKQASTVLATLSVDSDSGTLPSSGDWLLNATSGLITLVRRPDGLYQISMGRAVPGEGARDSVVTLQLKPGVGLIKPEGFPPRRDRDRGDLDQGKLLLVSLGEAQASDLEVWARSAFSCDVVNEPFAAVTSVQSGASYGCVLVHASRARVRDALQACRALRPLTRAAIVFASDEAVRSTDRIQILEAGADDCLTGGLDFRELGLRIRQSIATGAKPEVARATRAVLPAQIEGIAAGRTTPGFLAREIARRAGDPAFAFFCVLDVRTATLSPSDAEQTIASLIRTDEGDVVAMGPERCFVLLQGARPGQLTAFLDRLRVKLDQRAGVRAGVEIDVLSHPADAARIHERIGGAGGQAA